jgi:hypothetical protein
MSKESENLLGLPEVIIDTGVDTSGTVIAINDGYLPSIYKRQMFAEAVKQKMAIDATRFKALYGTEKIVEINKHAVTEFDKTAEFVSRVKKHAQGKEHQQYTSEFCHYMTQKVAQEIIGVANVGGTIILQVVSQTPYPEPEEPRGFLSRLFSR